MTEQQADSLAASSAGRSAYSRRRSGGHVALRRWGEDDVDFVVRHDRSFDTADQRGVRRPQCGGRAGVHRYTVGPLRVGARLGVAMTSLTGGVVGYVGALWTAQSGGKGFDRLLEARRTSAGWVHCRGSDDRVGLVCRPKAGSPAGGVHRALEHRFHPRCRAGGIRTGRTDEVIRTVPRRTQGRLPVRTNRLTARRPGASRWAGSVVFANDSARRLDVPRRPWAPSTRQACRMGGTAAACRRSDPAQLEVVVPADSPNGGGARAAADITGRAPPINDATVVACVQDQGLRQPQRQLPRQPLLGRVLTTERRPSPSAGEGLRGVAEGELEPKTRSVVASSRRAGRRPRQAASRRRAATGSSPMRVCGPDGASQPTMPP